MKKYNELKKYCKEISDLQAMLNIVEWDLRMNCPKRAKDYVISLQAELEEKIFRLKTDEEYEKRLKECIDCEYFNKLEDPEQRIIKKLLKDYSNDKKVPQEFYKEYVTLCSKSTSVWEEAKINNNYELFKPYLKQVIEMTKKYYSFIDSSKNLYDVMLNSYEEGMTTSEIDKLFDELKVSLIPLVKNAKKGSNFIIKNKYTNEELMECSRFLLSYIGFDLDRGSLGIYPHGFTTKVSPNDIRIAFNKVTDPISFVSTIIHEGGHGIFEQNISDKLSLYNNDCVGNLYGLHESQSRLFENILGRNINFWIPIYDKIKKILKIDCNLDEFVNELNNVNLGYIRVDADELTYCLHIILRYEIERDLFNNIISVDDLPNIWNKKMKDYLGLEVFNDNEGLMQDIHWSEGGFGYFPSYLLGTIYDGVFLDVIEENFGSIDELLKSGDVKKITDFLIKNIYVNGGAYTSKELIEKVFNKEISVDPIIKYFNRKYGK